MVGKVLIIARDQKEWKERPLSKNESIAKSLEELGFRVTRHSVRQPRLRGNFDFIFVAKLLTPPPSWIWGLGPVVWWYCDYRPPYDEAGNKHFRWMSKAEFKLTQFDDGRGIWVPPFAWCDDYDPKTERKQDWLWTGQKASLGQRDIRDADVACLPEGIRLYGWGGDNTFVRGQKYVELIQTHKWGLCVSHFNNVNNYTSNRLANYIAGGITPVVRNFPGVENMVPPDTFVYNDRQELIDFIKDPVRQDPKEVHEFAREYYDTRVWVRRLLHIIGYQL